MLSLNLMGYFFKICIFISCVTDFNNNCHGCDHINKSAFLIHSICHSIFIYIQISLTFLWTQPHVTPLNTIRFGNCYTGFIESRFFFAFYYHQILGFCEYCLRRPFCSTVNDQDYNFKVTERYLDNNIWFMIKSLEQVCGGIRSSRIMSSENFILLRAAKYKVLSCNTQANHEIIVNNLDELF